MSEQRFTAPETGWYKVTLGDPMERLADDDGKQRLAEGETGVVRMEVTESDGFREVRGYQNSGRDVEISEAQVIPSGAWVTLPWN